MLPASLHETVACAVMRHVATHGDPCVIAVVTVVTDALVVLVRVSFAVTFDVDGWFSTTVLLMQVLAPAVVRLSLPAGHGLRCEARFPKDLLLARCHAAARMHGDDHWRQVGKKTPSLSLLTRRAARLRTPRTLSCARAAGRSLALVRVF